VDVALESLSGGSTVKGSYTTRVPAGSQELMRARGTVNESTFQGVLVQDPRGAAWTGRFGASPELGLLAGDPLGRHYEVHGKVGEVEAHLEVRFKEAWKPEFRDYIIQGTVGGLAYQTETHIVTDQENVPVGITLRGSLGEARISKDYTISYQPEGAGLKILIEGGGENAGITQKVKTVTLLGG
jgi:hypothetical protein